MRACYYICITSQPLCDCPQSFKLVRGRTTVASPAEAASVRIFVKSTRKANVPRLEKTCRRWLANNKGADQPAHSRSLISTFVIRFLESAISKLATSEISIF